MKLKLPFALIAVASVGLSLPSTAQQTVTADPYMAVLRTDPATIRAGMKPVTLDVFVMDSKTMAPSEDLAVTASLSMPSMAGMTFDPPKVSAGTKPGHWSVQVTFPHAGDYVLSLIVKPATGPSTLLAFKITPGIAGASSMQGMGGMQGMAMTGTFGKWPASREGSGTTWQPDSSPMLMTALHSTGGLELTAMGTIQGGFVDDGGKRGDSGLFSSSMIMLMGRRETAGGTFGLHFMASLDAIINSREGVPNLFQNGFTVHGVDVADRKDPHNVFAEVAASFSREFSKDWSGFVYGGPVGEPALGNVMFFHRTSGLEVPEAPISHDSFDGTHISVGVATLGLVYQDKWKIEGSYFNGHEPTDLYTVGDVALNSASGRLSFNPSRDWSFSTSYGYLNSDVNEHRATFGASYSHSLPGGDNLSATAYLGQNIVHGSADSSAWLLEATLFHGDDAYFMRFERADKDELADVPLGRYLISKLLLGDVHNFARDGHLDFGLGAYVGFYGFPSSLEPLYGKSPITLGVFLRIRPGKS